jgi:hypothetical protein
MPIATKRNSTMPCLFPRSATKRKQTHRKPTAFPAVCYNYRVNQPRATTLTVMATKTTTPSQWLLERTNREGYLEQVVYTGPLSRKPKGWIVVGEA